MVAFWKDVAAKVSLTFEYHRGTLLNIRICRPLITLEHLG